MLEQHRIEYLQAMGIQLWMPREALPNAAEPLWLPQSQDNEPSSAAPEAVVGGHAAELLAGMGLGDIGSSSTVAKDPTAQTTQADKPVTAPSTQPIEAHPSSKAADSILPSASATNNDAGKAATTNSAADTDIVDMTVPKFALNFALWPCGILWVSSTPASAEMQRYQSAVSSFVTGSPYIQHSTFQFVWPYLEGSSEDQSKPVALRALQAQWQQIQSQPVKGWIAMDEESQQWFSQVADSALVAVTTPADLVLAENKKKLWALLAAQAKN